MTRYDAVVVGSGPNGLAAAITLARAGFSVLVRERNETIGGAARTEELTLPGFQHDSYSSIYPLGVGSPFLRTLPLEEHGLEWLHPPAPFAHPFDDGTAAVCEYSVAATEEGLGADGRQWRRVHGPLVDQWEALADDILDPIAVPRHPIALARFGVRALLSCERLCRSVFETNRARALFAGSAAHAGIGLHRLATASYAMVLNLAAHAVGWPMAKGGAGKITQAMASYLRQLGGEIETGIPVTSLDELPPSRVVLLDLTVRQVLRIAGDRLPGHYRSRLEGFRYGPGAFKVDWILSEPIPWRAPECARAGTVHVAGSFEDVLASEAAPDAGRTPERPYMLLGQPTLFDPQRSPDGRQMAWAYCHVPNGSRMDMTERMEAQVERFAPGFRDLIVARKVLSPAELESRNPNLVGGDVNGGAGHVGQLIFRPMVTAHPYATPIDGLYICSASTPPGGGVHGMCGYNAAKAALKELRG